MSEELQILPIEKAEELIKSFSRIDEWRPGEGGYISLGSNVGIKCAIKCVEQIIEAINDRLDDSLEAIVSEYWQQVLEALKERK